MLELEGLYKRIELLSKYLELYDKEYTKEKYEFSKNLKECKKSKSNLDNYINSYSEESDEILEEYLDLIDKDLSLDIKAIDAKFKIKSILEKQELIKYEIINITKVILEKSDNSIDNINKKVLNNIEYENTRNIINNVFIEKKKEKTK